MHQADKADSIERAKASSICRATDLRLCSGCKQTLQGKAAEKSSQLQVVSQDCHTWSLCYRAGEWQVSNVKSRPKVPKLCQHSQQMLKDRAACRQAVSADWSRLATNILVQVMVKIGPEDQPEQRYRNLLRVIQHLHGSDSAIQ